VAHGREPPIVLRKTQVAQAQQPPVARRKVARPGRTVPERVVQQTVEPLVALLVQRGE
jgi:hypothetical protein